MGERIELSAADGHRFGAWHAPARGTGRGALVIAQEIFGVTEHIRRVADAYAADGYNVLAPALFDRLHRDLALDYDSAGVARGRALKAQVPVEQALGDLAAAVHHLRAQWPVALIGYCWGGTLAWAGAARIDALVASVCYYGGGIAELLDLAPRCPVLLHFGEHDQGIPLADVDKVRAAYPALPLHLYPAGHGFNCDARGSWHVESAALARQRTLEFLQRHLG